MPYSLDDLRQRLTLLDARVDAARQRFHEAQLAAAQAEEDLKIEKSRRDGAANFVAELEAEATATSSTEKRASAPVGATGAGGTTDLIFGILRQHPDGVHIHELQKIAAGQGHDLDGEQVRSAVTYLRRRGDAENVRRGVWRVTNADYFLQLNGPAEAGPSDEAPSPLRPVDGG